MKSLSLAITVLLLAACPACEGEPPKTPAAAALPLPGETAAAVAPTTADATEATAAPAAAPGPAALPPCACNCNCAGVASGDGGAPPPGAAAAAVAAPSPAAAADQASVSGDVTSTPKAAAANAVVYLEDAPVDPAAKMTATITNHMMNFVPFVSVVPVGGKFVFTNDDPFPHNVFSSDGERFNMGMIPQHTARARVFKSAGAYALLCNVHPGMLGYAVVTPSSYFAKADAHGHFVIKNVPAGTYKVTAWAPRVQPVTQPVTVKGADVPITFELHR